MVRIDHCVCTQKPFTQIRQEALAEGVAPEEAWRRITGGKGCGMCRPYVRQAVATGQCVFHELLSEEPESQASSGEA